MADKVADPTEQREIIRCVSIFGHTTRRGLVGLVVGDRAPQFMSPAEARSVAADLLQTATAAETDEVLVLWLTDRMGFELEQAAPVLRDLRHIREVRLADDPPVEHV